LNTPLWDYNIKNRNILLQKQKQKQYNTTVEYTSLGSQYQKQKYFIAKKKQKKKNQYNTIVEYLSLGSQYQKQKHFIVK